MFASFVTLEVAANLALELALVALGPLHVDAVDRSFVGLEVAVALALAGLVFMQEARVMNDCLQSQTSETPFSRDFRFINTTDF